jgi:hypothetical protein
VEGSGSEGIELEESLDAGEVAGSDDSGNLQNSLDSEDFEILKVSPVLGDHKFKLEIGVLIAALNWRDIKCLAVRAPQESSQQQGSERGQCLSLYITPLTMDFAHPDYEVSAVMMAAIKCQDDRLGERGARPEWVWESWQDFVFRQESEVWGAWVVLRGIPLP